MGYTAAAMIISAVVSAGASAYSTSVSSGEAGFAEGQSATVFGEQQGYEQQLQNLIQNPSSVTSTPGYQFQLQQGAQTLANQLGASGLHGSGTEAASLTAYGQNYASSALTQQETLLSQLAGITAPSSASSLNSNANQATSNSNQALTQALSALGYGAGRVTTAGGTTGPGSVGSTAYTGFNSDIPSYTGAAGSGDDIGYFQGVVGGDAAAAGPG